MRCLSPKTSKFLVFIIGMKVSFNLLSRLRVNYNEKPNDLVKTNRSTNNTPWQFCDLKRKKFPGTRDD